MYQIRYTISIKVRGLSAANNARKISSLYQSNRHLSEVEDTILSSDSLKAMISVPLISVKPRVYFKDTCR